MEIKENFLVTKSNDLVNSRYDLTTLEQKIILLLASLVQPEDEKFKEYNIKIDTFMKVLGLTGKSKYDDIPKIAMGLMKKVFEIKRNNNPLVIAWLSSAEYHKKEGYITLEFSPKLRPYLLNLKEFYTSYKLENILFLKGKYSIRLYEILKSNAFKKDIRISIEHLRDLFKITNEYERYNDFKRKVLEYAKKELQAKTDISFEYTEIKEGKKIVAINFNIISTDLVKIGQTNFKGNTLDDNLENTLVKIQKILENQITKKDAESIYTKANGDIEKIKMAYRISKNSKEEIKNLVGYIIKLVSMEEIQEPIVVKQKKEPSKRPNGNFEQRAYTKEDFVAIENSLLYINTKNNEICESCKIEDCNNNCPLDQALSAQ